MSFRRLVLALVMALLFSSGFSTSALVEESNWPQWRGPQGLGISEEKDLPAEWSASKNVRWRTPIRGRGLSSPIVWQKRVFLT